MQNRLAQAESRCAQIETQLALAEKKIMEMGSSMSKLSNFKQSVIQVRSRYIWVRRSQKLLTALQSLEGVREFASSVDGRSRSVSANAMAQAAHHAIMAANNEPNYPEVHGTWFFPHSHKFLAVDIDDPNLFEVEQYRATQVPQFSSQPVISINMSPLDNMVVRETSMNAASRQQVSNNGKYQPYVAPSMSTLNQSIPIASQMQQQQQQQEQQQLNVQHQQQHARSRATSSTSRQTQNGMHSYSSQPASPQPVPPPQAPGSATSTSISASPRLAAKSGTQAVDGRDFFKQARSVLNYDEVSSFYLPSFKGLMFISLAD